MHFLINHWKNLTDGLAIGTFIGTLINVLPLATGLFTLVWLWYRIKDMRLSIEIKKLQKEKLEKIE